MIWAFPIIRDHRKMYLSVIIATYNRCENLKEALRTLYQQENDGTFDYEIIVIDNNSKDQTREVVESFIAKEGLKVRYIFEPIQGKVYALNTGITHAKGEIVAFTDDDVSVDSKWVLNIKQCFEKFHCDGCGGRILPVYPENTPQWLKDNLDILRGTIVFYDYGEDVQKYEKSMYEFLGANYAFRKAMFEECGVFRTDLGTGKPPLGEDTEFISRLQKHNKKLYYCGKALVWHPVDLKRTRLSFITKWNVALGRYRVITNERKTITPDLVYYFGVPRYLIRDMLQNGLALVLNIFNKREFLKRWIMLSRNWGRVIEFKKTYLNMKAGNSHNVD